MNTGIYDAYLATEVNPALLKELDVQSKLVVSGDAGPAYAIQASTNLSNWATSFTTNAPALTFQFVDPA